MRRKNIIFAAKYAVNSLIIRRKKEKRYVYLARKRVSKF